MRVLLLLLALAVSSCAVTPKGEDNYNAVFDLSATPTDDNLAFGLGLYGYREQGTGMYLNLLASIEHREDYNFGSNIFNDPVVGEETDVWAFNIGATRSLVTADRFTWGAFGGIGYAGETTWLELDDPTNILDGPDGVYHIEKERTSGFNVNLGTHVIIRRAAIGVSFNTMLSTVTLHLGLTI